MQLGMNSLGMELCFRTLKILGKEIPEEGICTLCRYSLHYCQLSVLEAGSLAVSGRPAPGPF